VTRIDEHDEELRRCPRLGHDVTFAYCRAESESTPCRLVLDCWWERFDVRAYAESHFSSEVRAKLEDPRPPNKMASLLDLIQQAQSRIEKD